jgi:predicted nucleic acid-binding protein
MSARFFLDTNIFVYSLDLTAPRKAKRAAQLIRDGLETGNGIVSYQVVQEYLNTVFRPLLAIQSSPSLFMEAFQVYSHHRLGWYDSLIVAAAEQGGCSVLYTEDLQHGRRIGNLKIEDPFR